MAAKLTYEELEDAEDRFVLEECVGEGVFGRVHRANARRANGNKKKKVAVKIREFREENERFLREEYGVLRDFCHHLNLPEFFGAFKNFGATGSKEIWFVMELCEGGAVVDLVGELHRKNRRMAEEHVAFVLKEVVKALTHLHKNHVVHRNVRASNILMTADGEIKLVDFALSRRLDSTLDKTGTTLGSPYWMAPEVVTSAGEEKYGNRADVWAVGITAIELGDGETPFGDMHPTRALFQIVRNPPPTLYRPSNWSETYNDFVSECLVKNPEHRPFMAELLQHPFLTAIPENNYHFAQELKTLAAQPMKRAHRHEGIIYGNCLRRRSSVVAAAQPERAVLEDLAALDDVSEDAILEELSARMRQGQFQTFLGDVLLVLNPNGPQDVYGDEVQKRYNCKSRSDNAPHVYAVADGAYQHAIHHVLPQNILLLGESGSGKTTNFLHLMAHLLYLGRNDNVNGDRIARAAKALQAFTNSATPLNTNSTRAIFKAELVYGRSGKITGAVFNVLQLEKIRVSSSSDMDQSNFHALRFMYDALSISKNLTRYHLEEGRSYRYLRAAACAAQSEDFETIEATFEDYGFAKEQIEAVRCVLAAVLLLGEIDCAILEDETVIIKNEEVALAVAKLLKVDGRELISSLTDGDALANNLYARLVDYLVGAVNHKLSFGRAIFGEHYSIRIFDVFGFESFEVNRLQQLLVNTFNEQLRYLYVQRVFAWEALETNEENLPFTPIHYYDNKSTIDDVLGKHGGGVLACVDDATKNRRDGRYIIECLENKASSNGVKIGGESEFSVAHYTGRVAYAVGDMPKRNGDFLPPEVIEVLARSDDPIIKSLFAAKPSKTGNAAIVKFDDRNKFPNLSEGQGSPRTVAATYRSVCLEFLKELSVGGGTGGTHFVLCVRSDAEGKPRGFQEDLVRQQLRALAAVETARARQKGYPHRVTCPEFLRRYKLLAFDFDENVEITRDNCRLLLVRLKMEGWMIGKTKVFLKYYNEEYLTRLHETQVRKVVKIQCMMRSFLARRKLAKRLREASVSQLRRGSQPEMTPEEAAIILQKAYRGVTARKVYGPLVSKTGRLDEETRDFIRRYSKKWKSKSLFQVVLQYRAAKCHDFFNLSQQVHFFNQKIVHNLHLTTGKAVDLNCVEANAQAVVWLDDMRPPVLKLPFRLDEVPYFDTSYMCDPVTSGRSAADAEDDAWDSPFRWRENLSSRIASSLHGGHEREIFDGNSRKSIDFPYTRDPRRPAQDTAAASTETEVASETEDPPEQTDETTEAKEEEDAPEAEKDEINRKPVEVPPPANPIAELQQLARRLSRSEDDPPFDFQSMLRKTNFQRESLKRAFGSLQAISRRQSATEDVTASSLKICEDVASLRKHGSVDALDSRAISAEVAPGIFMEGLVTDL